jgi:glycosyltransferase involved in cell wall biosynthesis
MPAYNAAKTIKMAAESILAQSWRNLELIIIDDCSTDTTLREAELLKQRDPRVKVLALPENIGNYPAKNYALGHATGEYLTVHDADDWAFETRIESQLATLLKDRSLTCTIGRMVRMTPEGQTTRSQPLDWITTDGVRRLCFPSLTIQMNYFKEVLGAWDSVRFGADQEILHRIDRFERKKLRFTDAALMIQLDAEGSLTRAPQSYSDERGESPGRAKYRDTWRARHALASSIPRLATGRN